MSHEAILQEITASLQMVKSYDFTMHVGFKEEDDLKFSLHINPNATEGGSESSTRKNLFECFLAQ